MLTKNVYSTPHFLALDIGAGNGRAFIGTYMEKHFTIEEVYRFSNKPVYLHGHYYWDFLYLWEEVLTALKKIAAAGISRLEGVGVDSWNCDFGLVFPDGSLFSNPFAYRDRTGSSLLPELKELLQGIDLYALTGIPLTEITGIVRLYQIRKLFHLHLKASELRYLPIADLLRFYLCGNIHTDETILWGSQLADIKTRDWHPDLLNSLKFPRQLFPPVVSPGTKVGQFLPKIQKMSGIKEAECIAVCGHDSASAAVAVSQDTECVFISLGTWSAVGVALNSPCMNPRAQETGFVNELGYRSILFMKNMMGFYVLEELRAAWKLAGFECSYERLIEEAAHAPEFERKIDLNLPELFSDVHPDKVYSLLDISEHTTTSVTLATRAILEGLAFSYRQAIDTLEELLDRQLTSIHIIGGGSKNTLLCQMTADVCKKPVIAGPAEATVGGNFALQCIACGMVDSIDQFWRIFDWGSAKVTYEPRKVRKWEKAYERWQGMVAR
jgi:rhamnulokinase